MWIILSISEEYDLIKPTLSLPRHLGIQFTIDRLKNIVDSSNDRFVAINKLFSVILEPDFDAHACMSAITIVDGEVGYH